MKLKNKLNRDRLTKLLGEWKITDELGFRYKLITAIIGDKL